MAYFDFSQMDDDALRSLQAAEGTTGSQARAIALELQTRAFNARFEPAQGVPSAGTVDGVGTSILNVQDLSQAQVAALVQRALWATHKAGCKELLVNASPAGDKTKGQRKSKAICAARINLLTQVCEGMSRKVQVTDIVPDAEHPEQISVYLN